MMKLMTSILRLKRSIADDELATSTLRLTVCVNRCHRNGLELLRDESEYTPAV